eukprot:7515873-Lingulodinium_polyedra.AAC.1
MTDPGEHSALADVLPGGVPRPARSEGWWHLVCALARLAPGLRPRRVTPTALWRLLHGGHVLPVGATWQRLLDGVTLGRLRRA